MRAEPIPELVEGSAQLTETFFHIFEEKTAGDAGGLEDGAVVLNDAPTDLKIDPAPTHPT